MRPSSRLRILFLNLCSSIFLTNTTHSQTYHTPAPLHLLHTRLTTPKGTILLIRGEANTEQQKQELQDITHLLDALGYNVVLSPHTRKDAAQAWQQLKNKKAGLTHQGPRLAIMGFNTGAPLAALTVQRLDETQQPDDLILISPEGMDQTLPGTVTPAIMPPLHPTARLWTIVSEKDSAAEIKASSEYAKIWKGYDGIEKFQHITDSGNISTLISSLLQSPDASSTPPSPNTTLNPAAIPVEGYSRQRHEEKLTQLAKEKFQLLMIGNSITNNFDKPEYQPIWRQFYAPRHALNLGYSGYRTENLLWNLQNGELEGQSPKVAVLEIGTNNVDEKNYPTRHTARQLAGGIEAIVKLLREKLPATKIIVLRCFPGCYGGPNPTSHRAILERASDIVSRLADGENIFYCDVNYVFLHLDGSIDHEKMPDWLHPNPAGAKAWAQAMEPLLTQLMGDSSRDTDIPHNTAIIPATKLEEDSYDWWARHAEVLRIKDSINPDIVMIGNSITHFWGGLPQLRFADGRLRTPNGAKSWAGLFGDRRVLNLGFGWDRTQNVLWRLDHGEVDGLHPRLVVINIGTNNTSATDHARMNTAPEIVEGIKAVYGRIRSKMPGSKVVLMAIFAREEKPDNPRRILIDETNRQLEIFAKEEKITFLNIGPRFLAPDGTMLPGLTSDFTHPTDKGYQIWADALRPYVNEY